MPEEDATEMDFPQVTNLITKLAGSGVSGKSNDTSAN
jgi:hypothetical protein